MPGRSLISQTFGSILSHRLGEHHLQSSVRAQLHKRVVDRVDDRPAVGVIDQRWVECWRLGGEVDRKLGGVLPMLGAIALRPPFLEHAAPRLPPWRWRRRASGVSTDVVAIDPSLPPLARFRLCLRGHVPPANHLSS